MEAPLPFVVTMTEDEKANGSVAGRKAGGQTGSM